MPPVSACPDGKQLEALLLGRLSAAEAGPLEEHVAACTRCAARLDQLQASDPFSESLRGADDTQMCHDQELARSIIPWLKRLRPREETVTILPESSDAQDSAAEDSAAAGLGSLPSAATGAGHDGTLAGATYDFLSPAQGGAELGRLGPYRVLQTLGSGGMGMVFLAEDPLLGRRIALKVIKPELLERGEVRQQFLEEAQSVAALEHDNIITIYHVGEEQGVPYLALPLLRGQSLEERLQGSAGALPLEETLRYGRELAAGLAAAHDRGLIHRDIKPSNVWLETKESGAAEPSHEEQEPGPGTNAEAPARVKILDFGLAQARGGTDAGSPKKLVGTPAYMAPEQARGEALDARADLFSLGCVLYRMATGKAPFKGDGVISTVFNVATARPAPPRELNAELPAPLSELIDRLLAKKPADRPASAHEVVRAIEEIERALQPKPSRLRWLLSAAVLAALVGGSVWLLTPGDPGPPAPGEVSLVYDEPDQRLALRLGEGPERTIYVKTGSKLTLPPGEYLLRPVAETKGRRLMPERFEVKSGESRIIPLRLVGEIRRHELHSQTVTAVALSPLAGSLLALSAGNDRGVVLWNAGGEEAPEVLGEHDSPVRCVAFSQDGQWAVSGGGGRVKRPGPPLRVWDPRQTRVRQCPARCRRDDCRAGSVCRQEASARGRSRRDRGFARRGDRAGRFSADSARAPGGAWRGDVAGRHAGPERRRRQAAGPLGSRPGAASQELARS